jgi:methionine-rich copper-binding protein CopC
LSDKKIISRKVFLAFLILLGFGFIFPTKALSHGFLEACMEISGDASGDGYFDGSHCAYGITDRFPYDDSVEFTPNTLSITWSYSSVNTGAGNLYFYNTTTGSFPLAIACSTLTAAGPATYTTPIAALTPGHNISITFDSDCFDTGVGVSDPTFWNFTVAGSPPDTTNPLMTALSPADNSSGVAVGANLSITFDEAVNVASGYAYVRRASDSVAVHTIDITSGLVTGDGTSTITFNPSSDLNPGTAYYVNIDASAIDDLAGNSYAGISSTTTWNFTTLDNVNPTVFSLNPVDDSPAVAVGANFAVTFSEPVTVGTGNVRIHLASDNSVVETMSITGPRVSGDGTTTLIFDPISNLNISTAYYIQIDASAVDDLAGNSFAGILDTTSWSFTTAAGSSVTTDPFDGETGVCTTRGLTITFPQAMFSDRNNRAGTINVSCGNPAVTVLSEICEPGTFQGSGTTTLTKNFVTRESSTCKINISNNCIHDALNNYWAGTSIEFDTSASVCTSGSCVPIRTIIEPLDDTPNAPPNTDLRVDFPSEVMLETAYDVVSQFTIHRSADDSVYAQYSLNMDGDNTGSLLDAYGIGTTSLIIDPKVNFPPAAYYVNYSVLLRNCGYDTISDTTTWNFTVGATAPLMLLEKTPRNNRLNVGIDTYLELTYDNPVYRGVGSLRVYRADDDTLIDTVTAASARIYGIGTPIVRIFPVNGLDYRTDYYILADEGFLNGGSPTLPSEEIKRVSLDDKKKWYFRTIQMHKIPFFRNWTDDR